MITTVTRQQFFTALADVSEQTIFDRFNVPILDRFGAEIETGRNTVYQGVSADANYPDWIEFSAAKLVQVGDPLYVQTQLALGYTSAQMLTLFEAAVQVPV